MYILQWHFQGHANYLLHWTSLAYRAHALVQLTNRSHDAVVIEWLRTLQTRSHLCGFIKVTIRPVFPGHVLFLGPTKYVKPGFLNHQKCLRFSICCVQFPFIVCVFAFLFRLPLWVLPSCMLPLVSRIQWSKTMGKLHLSHYPQHHNNRAASEQRAVCRQQHTVILNS